ncbi:MAG: DNA-binding domain-containing protein [Pseudomonadota bacterium]
MSAGLAELQRAFLADMRGLVPDAAMEHLASGGIPAATGIAIYRNAYAARLREALENDHPILGRYLGDALWARMCDGYIAAYPSRVRSLRHFGESLPEYLAGAEPFSASLQLAELARLERRLLDCFDAADADRTDWQSLLEMPHTDWPGLRLRFHPSVQYLRHAWNSIEIWNALKQDTMPPAAVREAGHDTSDWLLWRDDERITRFRSMAFDESLALRHFLYGGDFAGVCELLLQAHPPEAVPGAAIGLLRQWCDGGLVQCWRRQAPGPGSTQN